MSGNATRSRRQEGGLVQELKKTARKNSRGWSGFTLMELIVVIAVIGLLMALLVPALIAGLRRAQASKCRSNIRQLFIANTLYAADHGSYVAAEPDISGSNLKRWLGARDSKSDPFDETRGPLYEYLSQNGGIRSCPSFKDYRSGADYNAFEDACGGYGYNNRGVGSRAYWQGYNSNAVLNGMSPSAIRQPAATVMFCDTAYAQYDKKDNSPYLTEYSFAEAYHFLDDQQPPNEIGVASPTIHFRHSGKAHVVWCDGHVSSEAMTVVAKEKLFARFNLGWFGAKDNALFDPF